MVLPSKCHVPQFLDSSPSERLRELARRVHRPGIADNRV